MYSRVRRRDFRVEAGGSPAAGHFPCAAKESNQRKAAPEVAPRCHGVPLCCLPRQGGRGTRPGRAHKTCPAMGLEQSSPTTPCRVELLGAPHGEFSTAGSAPFVAQSKFHSDPINPMDGG